MYEHNIYRLIEASPFSNKLSYEAQEALADFFINTGATLDSINVDNIIVNGITSMTQKGFKKEFTKEQREDKYILFQDDYEVFFFN